MKAVVYDNNALVLRDMEKPVPGDNEVLVRIYAASVNAADYRSMKMGIIPKRKIFGSDIAGRVEAVGKDIRQFVIGDEVFGDISGCGLGGFAEYVAVPATPLAIKPAAVSFEAAAAVPMAGVTALQGLRNLGNIREGQKVLICGAGGGVGMFAVQLARHFGAKVTAVCGEKNMQAVRSLGAEHVINYMEQDFTKTSKRYDLVLAINGKQSLFTYRRLLAPKGTAVIMGGALSQVMKSMIFGKLLSIGGRKMKTLASKPSSKDLDFLIRLVENGTLKPVIDRRYPLKETAEAMRFLGLGHAQGKAVIAVV
jgi:NADPH:quinone reductase-like Zn-dependent oxidoreductase